MDAFRHPGGESPELTVFDGAALLALDMPSKGGGVPQPVRKGGRCKFSTVRNAWRTHGEGSQLPVDALPVRDTSGDGLPPSVLPTAVERLLMDSAGTASFSTSYPRAISPRSAKRSRRLSGTEGIVEVPSVSPPQRNW